MKLLGKRLERARVAKHFTGKQVAEHCDISEEYYRQIEGGFQSPSLKLLNILCIVLDVSPDYLLGYADAVPAPEAELQRLLPSYQSLVQEIETLLLERLPKKDPDGQ